LKALPQRRKYGVSQKRKEQNSSVKNLNEQ
jgi:hypothetical protein